MTTPRYVAVYKDGEYQLQRADCAYKAATYAAAAAGMALAVRGLLSRSRSGLLLAAAGAGAAYFGLTGNNPFSALMSKAVSTRRPADGPSYRNDHSHRSQQAPSDSVDESSMESFPASDPPARGLHAQGA